MKYKITDERLKGLKIHPSNGDAGIDLRACIDEALTIQPNEQVLINSGLQFAIPKGWVGKVYPRSGLGTKKGLVLANTVGIIDSTYRGNVFMPVKNKGKNPIVIEPMDRIVQMVVAPHFNYYEMHEVGELCTTERGESGFGDSGVK